MTEFHPCPNHLAQAIKAYCAKLVMRDAMEGRMNVYGSTLGKKYARVWKSDGTPDGKSVVCFVELKTGEIYQAESWKKPGRRTGLLVMGECQ